MKIIYETYMAAVAELRKIIGDPNLWMMFMLAPVAYPALYGAVYSGKYEKEIPIAVVDSDNSALSRNLIRMLDASPNVEVALKVVSKEQAEPLLKQGKIAAIAIVPKGAASEVARGSQSGVSVLISSGRLLTMSDVGFTTSNIVLDASKKITTEAAERLGYTNYQPAIAYDFRYINNPFLDYGDLILPALMMIIISQLGLIAAAASRASENQYNIQYEFRAFANVVGKLLTYQALFTVAGIVLSIFLFPLYGIKYSGSVASFALVFICGVFASTALGLFLGSFFRNKLITVILLGFTSYPFFVWTGYAWPSPQLPEGLRYLANLLPLTPFLNAIMRVTQLEQPLSTTAPQVITLLVLGIVYATVAGIRYKKTGFNKLNAKV